LPNFFDDQITEAMSSVSANLDSENTNIIYELPAVSANYRTSTGSRTIQIRVGLEVRKHQQRETMDVKLSDIASQLIATGSKRLHRTL
jgi:flagellar basal body-associated protein FliL